MLLASNVAVSGENVGPYVSLDFGAAIPADDGHTFYNANGVGGMDLDTGFAFGAASGYAFRNNLRVEGELAYQFNNVSLSSYNTKGRTYSGNKNIHTLAGLVNGYYDFKNESDFTPYLGAGVGIGGVVNESFADFGGVAFAYQVGGGLDYSVTEKITIGVKYRYFGLLNNKLDNNNAASHNIYAGARFYF